MKILLISIYNDEAIGLRLLHASINGKYDSRILFLKIYSPRKPLTEIEKELFYQYIEDWNPDLLAFSLTSPNFKLYQSLYPRLKKYKIIIGGWQASLNSEETLKFCDFLCIGEGEEAFIELIDALTNKTLTNDILNIWSKDKKNPVRPLIQNLNKYQFGVIDSNYCAYIENNSLYQVDPYTNNTRYGISIGRGCPFSCTYCSNSYMTTQLYPKQWSKIRYREMNNVIEELKMAKRTMPKLKSINFYDEIFLPKKEWAKEFFDRYKQEINIPFYCMFFPGTCKEDLLIMMKEAGLTGVWIGVQSGSERVRKEVFKRYYTNQKVLDQANLFQKYNISVKYDFIFNNPFETEEETEESIKLMALLPEPKSFNMFSLKFFPQTEITEMALKEGFITSQNLDDQLNIESPVYTIDKDDEQQIMDKIQTYNNSKERL
jgi:radical SAM superfamily enzyme YgiQ (UPF0313 family)